MGIRRVPAKFNRREWKFRASIGVAESDWVLMQKLAQFYDRLTEASEDPRLDEKTVVAIQTMYESLYHEAAELSGYGYIYDTVAPFKSERKAPARAKSGERKAVA